MTDHERQLIEKYYGLMPGVKLAECPPVLFLFNGSLGFKSEQENEEVFYAGSGKYFYDETFTKEKCAEVIVQPISEAILLRRPTDPTEQLREIRPFRSQR